VARGSTPDAEEEKADGYPYQARGEDKAVAGKWVWEFARLSLQPAVSITSKATSYLATNDKLFSQGALCFDERFTIHSIQPETPSTNQP
jgi:hypothetical protein